MDEKDLLTGLDRALDLIDGVLQCINESVYEPDNELKNTLSSAIKHFDVIWSLFKKAVLDEEEIG